jgi:hypothetical protein
MRLTHRTTCRVCESSSLTKVIDLGDNICLSDRATVIEYAHVHQSQSPDSAPH